MRLSFNADELAFQKEVRDWIAANMPPEVAEESRRSRTSHVSKERLLQWQKKLAERGWLCPNWPKEYGGPGWNSTQKFIFEMEMARADLPYLSSFSIKMVAPVLMKYGSEAQKKRFLPEDRRRRGAVVPGLFRAGLGLRSREPAHQGGAAGRPLHRQRPEDLDHQRPFRRLDLLPGAHLQRGQAPGGHLLPADRHEVARHPRRSDLPGRRHAHADAP